MKPPTNSSVTPNSAGKPRTAGRRSRLKLVLLILSAITAIALLVVSVWVFRLDRNIKTRFAEKRFAPPVEFFSAPETVYPDSIWPEGYFDSLFRRKNFRARAYGQPIQPGDYSLWSSEQCLNLIPALKREETNEEWATNPLPAKSIVGCVAFRNLQSLKTHGETQSNSTDDSVQIMAFSSATTIAAVFTGTQPQISPVASIEPELFAQYYGDTPILRKVIPLGAVPTNCLNALLATEDAKFLEHPGISFKGLARAAWTVLQPGRRAQGGSTITQQLVKNYFLTDERTLKRKLTEIPMAVLVERHATKDEILETYINLIYMGQNGPFQVRGFAAASEHYFGQSVADLDLPQCALLVGVLNNPGFFNPFIKPQNALKRRTQVLDRMLEQKLIDTEQAAAAKAAPLPTKPTRAMTEPAPYFVQSVRSQLREKGIDESEGLRIFTSLNLRAQETAHQSIRNGLDKLETGYAHLKKLKAQGKSLEAALISANPLTGEVQALVGGRGFLVSQFNRATSSKRQVGSVMKPFVFLTAFENQSADGKPYTALTLIADEGIEHKYDGQTWTPRNYEGTYNGPVPIFFALKESLNAATANLGMTVGLPNIIEAARRFGVTSKIDPVPSLTLGAFELSPMEVLGAYSAFARLGQRTPLILFRRVERADGSIILQNDTKAETVAASDSVAELVGVMKQTLVSGTARSARAAGFTHPAAGKTGTTNDKKDAWFAGFTPLHAAVVWVGYDDNTPHNLTGASGAVPIWTNYMKIAGSSFPPIDFPWPDNVGKLELTPEKQIQFGVPDDKEKNLSNIELIFKKDQMPSETTEIRDVTF